MLKGFRQYLLNLVTAVAATVDVVTMAVELHEGLCVELGVGAAWWVAVVRMRGVMRMGVCAQRGSARADRPRRGGGSAP